MLSNPPRILLKLSGEVLGGASGAGLDAPTLGRVADDVMAARALGAELAIVIGGGNFVRGSELAAAGTRRVVGDQIGMLATVMNALAFADTLIARGQPAAVLSAIDAGPIAEGFSERRASELLGEGRVVLLAGGTGNPLFTTDTAACLRGVELGVDMVLKATKVDGVYSADPEHDPAAERYDELTFESVLERELGVMDLTAIQLCREHNMPIVVFDMAAPGALTKIVQGDKVGTLIQAGG